MQRNRDDALRQWRLAAQNGRKQLPAQNFAAGKAPGEFEPKHQLVDREAIGERSNSAIPCWWFMQTDTADPIVNRCQGQAAHAASMIWPRQLRGAGPAEVGASAGLPAKYAVPGKQGIQDSARKQDNRFLCRSDHWRQSFGAFSLSYRGRRNISNLRRPKQENRSRHIRFGPAGWKMHNKLFTHQPKRESVN